MKKISLLMLGLVLMVVSCKQNSVSIVKVEFPNDTFDGAVVELLLDPFGNESPPKEVAEVKNGMAEFRTDSLVEPVFCLVRLEQSDDMEAMEEMSDLLFVRDGGTTVIYLTEEGFFEIQKGPKRAEAFAKLTKDVQRFEEKSDSLIASGELTPEQLQEFDLEFANIYLKDYLPNNMKNTTGEHLFLLLYSLLTEEQRETLLSEARPAFKEKLSRLLEESGGTPSLVDTPFTDVEGFTTEDKAVKLSDVVAKNNYTLLDFWASWCAPCIEEIPYLKKTYATYRDQGFEIVSISLDRDREDWRKALSEHTPDWIQLIDNGEAANVYQVRSIPYTLLIDQTGKIVAQDLRGDDLLRTIERLLDSK